MARKKEEGLTQEVRLEQALVPVEEQPYDVPRNWVWTKGLAFLFPLETKRPIGDEFFYIDIDAIDNVNLRVVEPKLIETKNAPSRASRSLKSGDTLFSMVRPYLRNIAYVDDSLQDCIASTGFFVCRPSEAVHSRYLFWLMTSGYVVDGLNANMKGDNSPSIRKDDIESFFYPIPPLPEQHRIVERIESLFAKLDAAKELAQSALESFETRRAAILHKAFTGELTKGWREEHGVGLESWEDKPLSQICTAFQYGTSEKSNPTGKVAVVRMGNLQNGEIVWDNLKYTNNEDDIKKYQLRKGDVLFNRTNSPELVGKTSVYRGEIPAIFAGYLIKLVYNDEMVGDYLNFVLNSTAAREYCIGVKTDGVNQSNINAKKIGEFVIPVPLKKEQHEIVRILDSLFAQEQKARDLCDILDKIDLMKKAILARAFRGELETNDPEEESALELLKEACAK